VNTRSLLQAERSNSGYQPAPATTDGVRRQRTCACGGTAGPVGECAACRAKRLAREAKLAARQRSSGPGHTFSRLPIHPEASGDVLRQVAPQAPATTPATPATAPSGGSTVDCNASDIAQIGRARPIATAMVRKAVREIGSPSSLTTSTLLMKYFTDDSPMTRQNALIGFNSLLPGISSNFTIECEKVGSFMYDWFCGGHWAYVRPFAIGANVHLCESAFGQSDTALARILVHEASHKFSRTDDWAYCHNGCPPTLNRLAALYNADSYAMFARDVYVLVP
jgi:hypothetical protein